MPLRITNLVLLEKINNIKEDTEEIKKDYKADSKEKWKQINKNAQNISGMKAVSGVISGFISLVVAGLITYFGVKHQ